MHYLGPLCSVSLRDENQTPFVLRWSRTNLIVGFIMRRTSQEYIQPTVGARLRAEYVLPSLEKQESGCYGGLCSSRLTFLGGWWDAFFSEKCWARYFEKTTSGALPHFLEHKHSAGPSDFFPSSWGEEKFLQQCQSLLKLLKSQDWSNVWG